MVAAVALPAEQAEGHGLDTSNMASEEALANPGEREGQHKIIKDSASGQPTLYTWSAGERTWNKVGEIVGSKDGGGGGSTLGKRTTREGVRLPLRHRPRRRDGEAVQQGRRPVDGRPAVHLAPRPRPGRPRHRRQPHRQEHAGQRPRCNGAHERRPFTSGGAYRPGGGGAANGGGGGQNEPVHERRRVPPGRRRRRSPAPTTAATRTR